MNRLREKLARLHGKSTQVELETQTTDSTNSNNSDTLSQEAINSHNENVSNNIDAHFNRQIGTFALHFDDPFSEVYKENEIGLFTNEFGSFLLKRMVYPIAHFHGMYKLKQLREMSPFLARFFPEESHKNMDIEQVMFFDLETTGLGTGTGNIPFMVGFAYFLGEHYIVEQAVIRHVAEERALLAYLHRLSEKYKYLVTYNGKTFDWPLMVNRYIMNGMREEIWQPEHIDLLHPSRFIWRNALESCKLSHIEEVRLSITRVDDLPGSEAPDRYFKYLADFNPEHLIPVFKHNELDMLTLVSLSTRFAYLLSDQDVKQIIQLPHDPEEMIRTGLWLEKMGLTNQCESLFHIAAQLPLHYAPTLYKLSLRDKQIGNEERAIFLWEKIIESDHLDLRAKVDCCIQLAMYYEHKQKQLLEALSISELAETYISEQAFKRDITNKKEMITKTQIEDIKKRLLRLRKKVNSEN